MCTDVLAVIEYLARNDYTSIIQVGPCLLLAKDGARSVLFWIEESSPVVTVPTGVIDRAQTANARLDVICIKDPPRLTHIMNVLEDM